MNIAEIRFGIDLMKNAKQKQQAMSTLRRHEESRCLASSVKSAGVDLLREQRGTHGLPARLKAHLLAPDRRALASRSLAAPSPATAGLPLADPQ